MFCAWISIGNRWQLKLFFVPTSFPPLLCPYFLPSSPLHSLLASENLASSSWKFVLLVHPRLVDAGIMDFNILELKFEGAPPWTFPPVCICLFLLKLVKASNFPSELQSSALEHAQLHVPSIPIYTEGSKSSEGVGGAAVFPVFDVFISLPVVASIFTAKLCAIFLALSCISFHDSDIHNLF